MHFLQSKLCKYVLSIGGRASQQMSGPTWVVKVLIQGHYGHCVADFASHMSEFLTK